MENFICNIDCIFRGFAGETEMMNYTRFNKLLKDCQIADTKFSLIDGYIIFSQLVAKSTIKRISFDQFMTSLHIIAEKKKCLIDEIIIKIGRKGFSGPIFRGTNGCCRLSESRQNERMNALHVKKPNHDNDHNKRSQSLRR